MVPIIHMATHPPRYEGMMRRLEELKGQARIRVYGNGYDSVPQKLRSSLGPGLEFLCRVPDLKSSGKLHWLDEDRDSLYLTCDDDIFYPRDYVAKTVAASARYRYRCVTSWHGSVFRFTPRIRVPLSNRNYRRLVAYYDRIEKDVNVHMPGNGVSCFCPAITGMRWSDVGEPGTGDDEDVALYCQRHRVPVYVIGHLRHWLAPDLQVCHSDAMHMDAGTRVACDLKLEAYRDWRLYGASAKPETLA